MNRVPPEEPPVPLSAGELEYANAIAIFAGFKDDRFAAGDSALFEALEAMYKLKQLGFSFDFTAPGPTVFEVGSSVRGDVGFTFVVESQTDGTYTLRKRY